MVNGWNEGQYSPINPMTCLVESLPAWLLSWLKVAVNSIWSG